MLVILHSQSSVPTCIDVDQDSDIELIDKTPGPRRVQLERVAKLLEFFHPPTNIKGEVSKAFARVYLSFSILNHSFF